MPLLYTDRSRRESQNHCNHRRYWEYHSYDGFGLKRKAQQMDLTTGTYTHKPLEEVCKLVMMGSGELRLKDGEIQLTEVARKQIREVIKKAQEDYRKDCQGGFYNQPPEALDQQLKEQLYLIEGLSWGWIRTCLPYFIQRYDFIAVEQEEHYVIGCTCGLGDGKGEPQDHEQRAKCGACEGVQQEAGSACTSCGVDGELSPACQGLIYASRPDLEIRDKSTGKLGILDFKTSKYASDREVESYRSSQQMAMGTIGMEARLQKPVEFYYISFLKKGERKASYNQFTKKFDGPKIQMSPFCLVDYRPGNPPLEPEVVTLDDRGKWYQRIPVWELEPQSKPQDWTLAEWVAWTMPKPVVSAQYLIVGPYDRQTHLIQRNLKQTLNSEQEWLEKLWKIYEETQQGAPIFEALDNHLSASWECSKFGERCIFYEICHQDRVDPENPLSSGLYEPRKPHHVWEAELKKKAGLDGTGNG